MSRQYTADGKRRSSQSHARHTWTCACGRVLNGNGGISSHKRACRTWMEYWLPRLDRLLENPSITETRGRLEQERDEIRKRLGRTAATRPPGSAGPPLGRISDDGDPAGQAAFDRDARTGVIR